MKNNVKILIVEDEKAASHFLAALLASGGYTPVIAPSGESAILMMLSHNPSLILLNLGLPDMDGMEVLKQLRQWSEAPVIILSARSGERDKITALDAGADDYVTKPFGSGELLARIRAALRQRERLRGLADPSDFVFSSGELSIDYARRVVRVGGQTVHLTPIEYKIVSLLSRHAGRILTHDHIIGEIWGPYGGDRQILRVNMGNIRKKLERDPSSPRYILTEARVGYKMADTLALD